MRITILYSTLAVILRVGASAANDDGGLRGSVNDLIDRDL